MDVLDYIHSESKRQSATVAEMGGMCRAYQWLVLKSNSTEDSSLTEHDIQMLSAYVTGNLDYRRVPVYFRSGGHAMNWMSVPRAMESLVASINFEVQEELLDEVGVESFTKEFLDIHPFVDGNGRVASLLRNYLMGTLNDPDPLPYYFGES